MPHRLPSPVLALLLCAATACVALARAAPAPDDQPPFLGGYLTESRVVYPLRVGEWKAIGEHRYEAAELGASVRYQQDGQTDRWMDLYVYPSGVLPDTAFAQVFDQQVSEIVQARRQAGHDVPEATDVRTFSAPGRYDALLGELAVKPRSAGFVFEHGGKRYHSVLAMTVRDLYFIKLRASLEAPADGPAALDTLRTQAEALLAGFAASLQVLNTGGCWRDLALVDLPADRAMPDGLLASANVGTPAEVWVADDRIYLPAAGADQAARQAASAMGRDLHAALRGRCHPPGSMNPRVPEGMRELRFEYGAPDAGSRDAMPARARRARA